MDPFIRTATHIRQTHALKKEMDQKGLPAHEVDQKTHSKPSKPDESAESDSKYSLHLHSHSLYHAALTRQSSRPYMQDFYAIQEKIACNCTDCAQNRSENADSKDFGKTAPSCALYIVCDGHGHAGEDAAQSACQLLKSHLLSELSGWACDTQVSGTLKNLKHLFKRVDAELCAQCDPKAGTTCTLAFLHGNKLYMANVGDSTAKLMKRSVKTGHGGFGAFYESAHSENRENTLHWDEESPTGLEYAEGDAEIRAVDVSVDHSPTNKEEKERIQRLGGAIVYNNGMRVMGVLNMTKSLGNKELKPYVSGKPSLKCVDLTADSGDHHENILVMASDGLWNYCEMEDILDSVNQGCKTVENLIPTPGQLKEGGLGGESEINHRPAVEDLESLRAKEIVMHLGELAKKNKSADNLCILVVMLDRYSHARPKNAKNRENLAAGGEDAAVVSASQLPESSRAPPVGKTHGDPMIVADESDLSSSSSDGDEEMAKMESKKRMSPNSKKKRVQSKKAHMQ